MKTYDWVAWFIDEPFGGTPTAIYGQIKALDEDRASAIAYDAIPDDTPGSLLNWYVREVKA